MSSSLKAISVTKQSNTTEFHIRLSDVKYELLLCSLYLTYLEIAKNKCEQKRLKGEWNKLHERAK